VLWETPPTARGGAADPETVRRRSARTRQALRTPPCGEEHAVPRDDAPNWRVQLSHSVRTDGNHGQRV